MYQIKNEIKIEVTEKKSKFITRLLKVADEFEIKEKLKEIKKNEKGAVHNCFAYRILAANKSVVERKNDDGEPGGTAGAPMLAVLTGEELINILAVTTRYFGGIKLGTGGLVSVYKKGVAEALKQSVKEEYQESGIYIIKADISKADQIMNRLKKENIIILSKDFSESVAVKVRIEKNKSDILNNLAASINGILSEEK